MTSRQKAGSQPSPLLGDVATGEAPRPLGLIVIGHTSALLTWTWAIVVLVTLLLIRWVGDRWWGVTVLLFLPRWLFLGPLPFLALASGIARRPAHWLLQGVVALVVAGPLMGLSLPLYQLRARSPEGLRVRIMTYNRGVETLDSGRLIRFIEQERIDLICFQEGNNSQNPMLEAHLAKTGWHRDKNRYVASRYPIVAELPSIPFAEPPLNSSPLIIARVRIRTAPGVEFGVASVHMPTLRVGFYQLFDHDVDGLKEHIAWWDHEASRLLAALSEMGDLPLLVGGDLNVPSDHSTIAALGSFYRFGFEDAGWGYGYTRPSRYPWFRIDHIFASPEWLFTRCRVGPDFGSDHLPLIAEAVLTTPG